MKKFILILGTGVTFLFLMYSVIFCFCTVFFLSVAGLADQVFYQMNYNFDLVGLGVFFGLFGLLASPLIPTLYLLRFYDSKNIEVMEHGPSVVFGFVLFTIIVEASINTF